MDPEHVARALLYMASLPLDANVQTMTVMATRMPFVGARLTLPIAAGVGEWTTRITSNGIAISQFAKDCSSC